MERLGGDQLGMEADSQRMIFQWRGKGGEEDIDCNGRNGIRGRGMENERKREGNRESWYKK